MLLVVTLLVVLWILHEQGVVHQWGGADDSQPSQPQSQPQSQQIAVEQQPAPLQQPPTQPQQPTVSADDVRNSLILIVSKPFQTGGLLRSWKFNAVRNGIVHLQIYRPTNIKNGYVLVDENIYQIATLGDTTFNVDQTKQIVFKKGDIIGLQFPDLGTISYTKSDENVLVSQGTGTAATTPTTEKRTYAVSADITPRGQIREDLVGGTSGNPATNAQQILAAYTTQKLVPPDGTYWIKTALMQKPAQIFCNFSYRKGYGYMLIGSVSPTGSWLGLDTGAFPFNPAVSFGEYDTNGRVGSYYRKWAELDPSTVVDDDPYRCSVMGGLVYNQNGKFCGTKDGKRAKLPGGIAEIMFATGNGKYWTVINKSDLDTPTTQGKEKIVPVATSNNFDGKCEQNKYIYNKSRPSWINMGNDHACDTNLMFWGEAGNSDNTKWMSQNGGVQLFIGGVVPAAAPKKYKHNPSWHTAPGKSTYQSTFKEAQAVCRSMGKKVCSAKQLKDAQADGYGQCACGWTDTKSDKYQYTIGYPTNLDIWSGLQANKDQSGWCGRVGFNVCGTARPDQGVWGNEGADIYCCDKFVYSTDFTTLDQPYRMARVWIAKAEQKFEEMYNVAIPKGAKFVAFDITGMGISVKKASEHKYVLESYPKGTGPKNAQIPEKLIPITHGTLAIFAADIPDYNIKANADWPLGTGNTDIVRYGSVLKLFNGTSSRYLTATSDKYWHKGGSGLQSVFGYMQDGDGTDWLVKAERGLGKTDANGFGDEKAKFGKPISNGSTIRLEHKSLGYNLSSTPIYKTPTNSGNPEVHLHDKGPKGDSNDYWRVETGDSKYWYIDTPVRIVHVNTGRVLKVSTGTFSLAPTNSTVVNAVEVDAARGQNDMWVAKSPELAPMKIGKCERLLNKIAEAREYVHSGAPDAESHKDNIRKYHKRYNQECYNVSVASFQKVLEPKLTEISKQQSVLTQEQGTYGTLKKTRDDTTSAKVSRDSVKKDKDTELQKLLSRHCLPVKQCVKQMEQTGDVSAQCESLLPMLNGKVSDDLVNKIHDTIKGKDSVGNYDIRTHKDYYKLIKAAQVNSCY